MLSRLFRHILNSFDLLAPRECLVCERALRTGFLCWRCTPTSAECTGAGRCPRCFAVAPLPIGAPCCATCSLFPLPYSSVRYLWEYGGLPRDLIRALKYRPSLVLTRHAGALLAEAVKGWDGESCAWEVLVPIPPSPLSASRRLFSPCLELAHQVRRALPDAIVCDVLRHRTRRSPQAHRSHAERLVGVAALFTVRDPLRIAGRRVVLVEDVVTTGATVAAAATALLRAGATQVDLITLARTRVWSRFRGSVHRLFPDGCAAHILPPCLEAAGD